MNELDKKIAADMYRELKRLRAQNELLKSIAEESKEYLLDLLAERRSSYFGQEEKGNIPEITSLITRINEALSKMRLHDDI